LAQNKRLSKRRRGLRWTPRGGFWASGLHADSRTPHARLARGVPSCARGCGLLYLLSSEGDNNRFPDKDDAHASHCRVWLADYAAQDAAPSAVHSSYEPAILARRLNRNSFRTRSARHQSTSGVPIGRPRCSQNS
jgi:hypothetical protein